jgi:hypothetical protein
MVRKKVEASTFTLVPLNLIDDGKSFAANVYK